jgi:large subunit ribosomal protein L18
MSKKKLSCLPFRRKLQKRTNYKKRMQLLLSNTPRLVIRKSLKNIIAQIVLYNPDGDKIVVGAQAKELKKLGWQASTGNIPSSYLVGLLLGKKATEKKIIEAILDLGLHTSAKGGRLYALVKGVVDSGLKISVDEKVFPTEDRLTGKHISSYVDKANNNQFSKTKEHAKNISQQIETIKKKILER